VPERSSTSVRIRRADPEAIGRAVRLYAEGLRQQHPEVLSVRWFGSWVNGTASVGSDVDLCIVVRQAAGRRRDRSVEYLPRSFPVGIDLFVFTPEELKRLQEEHPSFSQAILRGVEV
jgi:predicted nucleotidyltransferase